MFSFSVSLLKLFLLLLLRHNSATLASPNASSSPFLGHYLILSASIEDKPAGGNGPPESRPYESNTSPSAHRSIDVNVSGTNPGALQVICKLPPWQPGTSSSSVNSSSAEESARAVDLRFKCEDPNVSVRLQALPHLDYNWGFYIVVALK